MDIHRTPPQVRHLKSALPLLSKPDESDTIFQRLKQGPLKVAVIGGGSWGTAVAKIAATNTAESYIFSSEVRMWLMEEMYEGKKLTEIINSEHENKRYLPGYSLPSNLIASSDLIETSRDADLILFVVPTQFLRATLRKMVGVVKPTATAISLIKGIEIIRGHLWLHTDVIRQFLGIECCILSGANVANDIAAEQFSETTVGYRDRTTAAIWQQLFDRPFFRVNCVPDVRGVEICGAIKNVVALAAGFCDGLKLGTNTKSAIIRIGVEEIRLFASLFFDGILEETFFDSAGFADLVTTCFGGRNVRCAKEFVVRGCKSSWEEIEADLLNGQKLQGNLCCKDVMHVLTIHKLTAFFPLFTATYNIAYEGYPPNSLIDAFSEANPRRIKLPEECNSCIIPTALAAAKNFLKTATTPDCLSDEE